MIKYLGSKRRLVGKLVELVAREAPDARTFLDVFSGTARVGMAMKQHGLRVIANDHNAYAHTLARCYVEADDTLTSILEQLVADLRDTPPAPGWFTRTLCEDARFFHPDNGARVDAIRDRIAQWARDGVIDDVTEAALLVSLMEAADRVDSTVGVQMAYLKQWAPRALNELELRVPALLARSKHGSGLALRMDARAVVREVESVDVAYLDPPYNQHSYLGNYHAWESLVLWDKPAVYGMAMKRVDVKDRTSVFNSRTDAKAALEDVIAHVRCQLLVVSFNDEGFFDRKTLEGMLATRGKVRVHAVPHARYVGAKIGIYNPAGERVGAVGRLTNHELVYVVHCS